MLKLFKNRQKVVHTYFLTTSTAAFAVGTSFVVLLLARAVQGIGSSLVAAAGYCLLAESFVDDEERKKAISHALNGVAIGTFGEF